MTRAAQKIECRTAGLSLRRSAGMPQDMMTRRATTAAFAGLLLSCRDQSAGPPAPPPGKLTLACAASMRPAVEEMVSAWAQHEKSVELVPVYGASGTLFAQISQRAPFDLFLSADTEYPRKLVAAGLAEADFLYATGRLALWVPKDSPLHPEKDGLACLTHPAAVKIAIANPVLAPYGRAAEDALRHAGIFNAVKHKLVPAENVAQAAQYAQSGAAQAGLVALSLTLTREMQRTGRAWSVPAETHAPLEQGGVILPWTRARAAAERFRDWLLSPAGQAVLARHGFVSPR
jgi:molybdate transport system substrate-binding protein